MFRQLSHTPIARQARLHRWATLRRPYSSSGDTEKATPTLHMPDDDKISHYKPPQEAQAESLGKHMPWRKASKEVTLAPCDYISSLPSKRVCSLAADMLNEWTKVSPGSVEIIKEMVELYANAGFMVDDVQDDSPIRRGKPAVHTIFGCAQAINASMYMTIQALQKVRRLSNVAAIDIALEEMDNLFLGQSLDIHWRFHLQCPSEEEYLNMVDNKTGPFFRVIARLLQAEAVTAASSSSEASSGIAISLEHLTTLLGRFYQIRDDYMNLQSSVYAEKKGSCEDLDEGKFSYPIVHCLLNSPTHRGHILGIFRQRPTAPGLDPKPLSPQAKGHILSCLEDAGSLRATLDRVNELEEALMDEIARLECATGIENPALRSLLKKLSLADGHE